MGSLSQKLLQHEGLGKGTQSPLYLFLLCAEGLSAMLRRDESGESLRGISVCRGAPRVSHLLFADDCIVFCKASTEEGLKVTKILEDYERESG